MLQICMFQCRMMHQDTLLSGKQQGAASVLEYAIICVLKRGRVFIYTLIESKTDSGKIHKRVCGSLQGRELICEADNLTG